MLLISLRLTIIPRVQRSVPLILELWARLSSPWVLVSLSIRRQGPSLQCLWVLLALHQFSPLPSNPRHFHGAVVYKAIRRYHTTGVTPLPGATWSWDEAEKRGERPREPVGWKVSHRTIQNRIPGRPQGSQPGWWCKTGSLGEHSCLASHHQGEQVRGARGWRPSPGPPVTRRVLQLVRLETRAYVFLTTLYTGVSEGILSALESWLWGSNTIEV